MEIDQKIDSVLNSWVVEGYLGASFDSIHKKNGHHVHHFYRGDVVSWKYLRLDSTPAFVQAMGVPILKRKVLSWNDVGQYFERILKKAEDSGYPFAKVSLGNLKIENGAYTSDVQVDLNGLIIYDSLIVKGGANIDQRFLMNVLNIRKGHPYNQNELQNIQKKIAQIPYVRATSQTQFVFKKGKVDTYIYVENKKANRFSGIIGFLPNSVDGKTNFTGDIDLGLVNTLKLGEQFKFKWQRIRPEVQDLKATIDLPFLLNSSFGFNGSLAIFRQDSSLLEVKSDIGVLYNFASEDHFKVYYSSYNSDRLDNDQTTDLGGSDYQAYGLGIGFTDLDYSFNPRKGYQFQISADAGTKNFRAPTVSDSTLNSIPENSSIYHVNANAQLFIPSGKRSVFAISLIGRSKINDFLLDNEMLRLGGNNSLRGFDEESLRVSSYIFFNSEYRLITDLNSNIFLFTNLAWTEKNSFLNYQNDVPYGFGAGANFDTKAGIFSITYALGSQNGNPILLDQSKVHFGFKSLF